MPRARVASTGCGAQNTTGSDVVCDGLSQASRTVPPWETLLYLAIAMTRKGHTSCILISVVPACLDINGKSCCLLLLEIESCEKGLKSLGKKLCGSPVLARLRRFG